jgi:hypothetical protein
MFTTFPTVMAYSTDHVSSKIDPLVHHGRHFCRTVHAMCNIHALLTQSIIRVVEQTPEEDLTLEYGVTHILRRHADLTFAEESAASTRCLKNF